MQIEQVLWIRAIIIKYYKRFETAIHFGLKLILGMSVLALINSTGLYHEKLNFLFTGALSIPFFLLLSILFAALPPTLGNALLILTILAQTSRSIEVAVFVFLLLLCILAFYGRVSPKKSYLIPIIIIAYKLNMPFAVALFAGLYLGITSAIPIIIGTGVSTFLPFFSQLANARQITGEIDLVELPAAFLDAYAEIFAHMTSNLDWIIWGFVLAMVTLAVHFISRLSIPFAKDIALVTGALVAILGLGIAGGIAGISIPMGSVFLGTLLSLLLVEFLRCFDSILDYRRTERVQFEDESNYYYVKVVPKITDPQLADAPASSGRGTRRPPRNDEQGIALPPRSRRDSSGVSSETRAYPYVGAGSRDAAPTRRPAPRPHPDDTDTP